jgi:thiamine pyrophosphokinase
MARGDLDSLIEQANRTLNNPAVQQCFDRLEKELVDAMAAIQLSSPEAEFEAVSLLRDLQAKRRLQKKLLIAGQAHKFKE